MGSGRRPTSIEMGITANQIYVSEKYHQNFDFVFFSIFLIQKITWYVVQKESAVSEFDSFQSGWERMENQRKMIHPIEATNHALRLGRTLSAGRRLIRHQCVRNSEYVEWLATVPCTECTLHTLHLQWTVASASLTLVCRYANWVGAKEVWCGHCAPNNTRSLDIDVIKPFH